MICITDRIQIKTYKVWVNDDFFSGCAVCGRLTKTTSIETAMTACSAELGFLLTVIICKIFGNILRNKC